MARVEAVFTLRDDMSSKLRRLTANAKATEKQLKLLRKEVNLLIRRLDALDRKDVTINIQTRGDKRAMANIIRVQAAANRLGATRAYARIGVDVDGTAMREMQQMARAAGAFGGGPSGSRGGGGAGGLNVGSMNTTFSYFQLRTRIIIGLFVAALGAVGPLITAVQSLGLAAAGAGAGIAALGGAYLALNAAAGDFFKTYSSKKQALDTANAALQSAATLEEAQAARKQISEITKTMTADEKRLYSAMTKTREAFRSLSTPAQQRQIVNMSVGMYDLARAVMSFTDMRGFVSKFVGVFDGLQKSFKESILDPNTIGLIKTSMKEMPAQFDSLARSTGHLGKIMLGLNAAAAPVVTELFSDIEKFFGQRAEARTSPEGIKRSRDFFRDMRPILDKVGGSLLNIYNNLAKIGRAGRGSVIPILNAFDKLVNAIGDVLSAGAEDFGESLAGLVVNLSDAIANVGPKVLKWLGWFTSALSNVLDALSRSSPVVKNAVGAFVAFLIFRRIVPGMRTFTNLLGRIVKLLLTSGLRKAIGAFGGMGRFGGGGAGGAAGGPAGTASRVGGIAVRIVSPIPLPVTMVGGAGGGTDIYGTPGGGKDGKGGRGGLGGRIGNYLTGLAGAGRLAAKFIPVVGTILTGLEATMLISGQGPMKELSPERISAHRGGPMGSGAYVARGRDMVSGMLATDADRQAAKMSGGGERIRANVMAQINKLPENMRTAAAKGASDMLAQLEAKGDVARGATQTFLKGAREELANFKTELSTLMTDLANARAAQASGVLGRPVAGPPSPGASETDGNARGGIITGFTLSTLGERGPEAVIPLTNRARRDQVLREAGLGGGAARGQRSSSPVINISGVTINSGDDMQSFVSQLEGAVRRAMTNIPYADAGAMLA